MKPMNDRPILTPRSEVRTTAAQPPSRKLEVGIGRLGLNLDNAAGHEHRIRRISARAAAIFAGRIDETLTAHSLESSTMDHLSAPPVSLNLNRMSNEEAASAIAGAWMEAVSRRLKL
jgi:hypothetical protein